ncbi:MAG: DUF4339 domain-containing protein [Verrucomicrobiales bacterium]|jgi:hypothetical protein|nr:DUF4339 domain-containing protein [Verrucomicrobiales bacterium]
MSDNPDTVSDTKYWLWDVVKQKAIGPFSFSELEAKSALWEIHGDSSVCRDGTTDWVPFRTIAQVESTKKAPEGTFDKKQYVNTIRQQSSYPTMRVVISFTANVLIFLGIVTAIGGIVFLLMDFGKISGVSDSLSTIDMLKYLGIRYIPVFFFAILLVIGGMVYRESSLMAIDLVDSFLDKHSRKFSDR